MNPQPQFDMREGQRSMDKLADALNRNSDTTEKAIEAAPKFIANIGQEIRDSIDHVAFAARNHGSMSLAFWLLIVVGYKLLKKWLGI